MHPRSPAGWSRIHQHFYSFATRGDESFLYLAGSKTCSHAHGHLTSGRQTPEWISFIFTLALTFQNQGWDLSQSQREGLKTDERYAKERIEPECF
jgi:hypothetical protein